MKTLLFLLFTTALNAQYVEYESDTEDAANVFMRGGYGNSPQIAAGCIFRVHDIGMGAELNIPWSDGSAKEFGIRLSYKWNAIEVGYGHYVLMFSTDKYDIGKNGFGSMFFAAYHRNVLRQNWFAEIDYMKGFRFTLGVNGLIAKLK